MTLIGKKDLPANDLRELLAYIKANKDQISFANAGVGSASHLCGTAPATINDLLGGQVDILCDQTTNTTQYIKAGRVKAYGTTSSARLDSLRELPTLSKQAYPGSRSWYGMAHLRA
jgi:tripartite-type tricarboxylate transporter receptor subunit TctC